eukprot:SAG31_NODE_4487_length_3194_cov_2.260743_2_plen_111_part_00
MKGVTRARVFASLAFGAAPVSPRHYRTFVLATTLMFKHSRTLDFYYDISYDPPQRKIVDGAQGQTNGDEENRRTCTPDSYSCTGSRVPRTTVNSDIHLRYNKGTAPLPVA